MDLEAQYDKLYRYCYFQCKDVQAAEDVVQETFLRWLEHYPGQKEREAIPTPVSYTHLTLPTILLV